MEEFKEMLAGMKTRSLEKMLYLKRIALVKKAMTIEGGKLFCDEGGKRNPICGAELNEKDAELLKKSMRKSIDRLKEEIKAIKEELRITTTEKDEGWTPLNVQQISKLKL